MGFGAVFATLMFIFVFTSVVIFTVTIQRNLAMSASEQHNKQRQADTYARMALTISSISYDYNAVNYWTDDLYADFQGTLTNAVVDGIGSILLSGPVYSNGSYISQAIDSGFSSNYTTLSWTSTTPLATSVKFQVRAADSIVGLSSVSFTGPKGTSADYYTISGGLINETLSPNRYVQYVAYLGTNDNTKTPQLKKVQLGIQRPVGQISINVTNTGAEALIPGNTDVYIGTRIPRNVSSRTIVLHDITNQALWDPGESMDITVFETLTSGKSVRITNSAAAAASTVSP